MPARAWGRLFLPAAGLSLLAALSCSSEDAASARTDASTGGSAGTAGAGGGAATGGAAGGSAGSGGASVGDAAPDAALDASSDATSDAPAKPQLVVATANTRCLLDDYEKRKAPLADGIAALDPDLLALQEICKSSSTDSLAELVNLISAKTGRVYTVARKNTHYNLLAFADEGIAVVTPHPVVWQKLVDLPKGVFDRGAVMTRVSTPVGTLLFVGTHLSFEPQADVRKLQLAKIRSEITAERQGDEPVLLAGDMNEKPNGAAIGETIAAGYVDLWALLKPGDPGLTSPVPGPKDRIDYVLALDSAPKLAPLSAALFLNAQVGGTWPSDHFGVTVTLSAAAP